MTSWLGYVPGRSLQAELMDDPAADPKELDQVYRELEMINRLLGGHAVSIRGVRELAPDGPIDVLDVGAGGGDFGRELSRFCARKRRALRYVGIELSAQAVDFARLASRGFAELKFEHGDLHDLPARSHDIVHMALTLHHFDDEGAIEMLRGMARVARRGVVVNDLHRGLVPYAAIKGLTQLLSRSRFVKNDGPLSVNRAFTRAELEQLVERAGLSLRRLQWMPMYRWLLICDPL